MRMRLKKRGQVPYGGMYEIKRHDLGMVGRATTFDGIRDQVFAYRRANALPIGLGFEEELENEICKLYPKECEGCDDRIPLKRRLSMADVVHGTKVILALKLAGGELVSNQEAMQRWEICNRCPLNVVFPIPCAGLCPELRSVVDGIIGGRRLPFDDDRRSCAICGCYSAAQVRVPYRHLEKGLTPEMKEAFQVAKTEFGCWKTPAT